MRKYILFIGLLMLAITLSAQSRKKASLSAQEEGAMLRVAQQIVESFQESCKRIASKDISLEEKRCVNGLVDRALKDVLDVRKNPSDLHGSNIEITGLTNKKVQRKSIKMYLYRLANLNYRSVKIETTRIAAAHEFYEDPNHPGWFVGNVTCTQTFTAALKATEQPVYLKDKVERTFKIYIRRVEYREKNHKRYQWQVKIHHITARNLAQ